MQNKANFRNNKMKTTFLLTKDYENEIVFMLTKNKPNQTQLQTNRPSFQNFLQKPYFLFISRPLNSSFSLRIFDFCPLIFDLLFPFPYLLSVQPSL
jgi:hypothetical protein